MGKTILKVVGFTVLGIGALVLSMAVIAGIFAATESGSKKEEPTTEKTKASTEQQDELSNEFLFKLYDYMEINSEALRLSSENDSDLSNEENIQIAQDAKDKFQEAVEIQDSMNPQTPEEQSIYKKLAQLERINNKSYDLLIKTFETGDYRHMEESTKYLEQSNEILDEVISETEG